MDRNKTYREKASKSRRSGNYNTAGDYYTLAAYHRFASSEWNEYTVWLAPNLLLYAALCYRVAGAEDRCQNRCEQGQLVVTDLRSRFEDEPAWVGLTHEIEGDFKVLAEDDSYRDAYERARETYQIVERNNAISEIVGWLSEEGFGENIRFFFRVAETVDYTIPDTVVPELRSQSPVRRIEYKREHFSSLVSKLRRGIDLDWTNSI